MVHKNDGPGAGPGGIWVEASAGVPKSVAQAKFFNMLQEETLALLDSAGITPSDASDDQVSAALDILLGSSGAAALKNRLINGAVELWQRGNSIAAGNAQAYTADRWAALADQAGAGTGAATISRQVFADGQVEVPGDPPVFLRWAQTTGATAGAPSLAQKVEDVATLAAGFATLSFWGKAATNANLQLRLTQKFGTGGSPDVVVGTATVPITTTWSRQSATFPVPSIAGKTVGPLSHLRFELLLPAASVFTFDLVNLQLETGENVTPFERRALQLEYPLAARYFEKSYPLDVNPGAPFDSGMRSSSSDYPLATTLYAFPYIAGRFRVPKRAKPALTWYANEGGITPGTLSRYQRSTADHAWQDNIPVLSTRQTSSRATGHPTHSGAPAPQGIEWMTIGANWTADAEL